MKSTSDQGVEARQFIRRGGAAQMKPTTDQGPVRYVIDERLDLNHFGPLRMSYIVASSYRSGSQYLCWRLWQTGLLGAPSEVLNPTSEMRVLMNRFKASSPADYIAKLLARRTSRNGVFGMKAHFHHFEAFQKEYPALLEVLSPTTYIYISRQDRIAQAVSMAKALQTDAWTSRMEEGPKPVVVYDREMIAHCLVDIEQQDITWRRWFETHNVTPFQVTYDDLTADAEGVVRSIVEFLGVQDDERDEVNVPPAKKQADETNQEWIERFEREMKADGQRRQADAVGDEGGLSSAGAEGEHSRDSHFLDRYGRLVKSIPAGAASATGFLDLIRLRRRYDAIVARNRNLFQNARVLDVMSSYGLWSLASLDAGAAHVVGVEPSPAPVEAATNTFNEYGVNSQSYQFVNSEAFAAIQDFEPDSFDLILCQGFFEQCDILQFFHQLNRLRPRHVILDTGIVLGEGPIVRFRLEIGEILGAPNHPLIMFLCDAFDFRWRLSDWRTMGIADWTGIHDYERDQRRTYILDRIS
jgi:LPS sulfotransferase NodH/SAM-dependent methyltransferase